MKLTDRTNPQAINYKCDYCKTLHCHKDMYDEHICYDCKDKKDKLSEEMIGK